MHEDVKWFFGVIILFGMLWFLSGSISGVGKTATKQQFIPPGSEPSSINFSYIGQNSSGQPINNAKTKTLTTQEEVTQGLQNAGIKVEQIKQELEKLEQSIHTSPLTGKIYIAGIGRSSSATNEYIVIQASNTNTEKMLVTGLRLQSVASGLGANIPKGVYLPFQNQINSEELIYLAPGEVAYIVTGRSPLGTSFRPNKCTGFFNQYQSFSIGLSNRCPAPRETDLPYGATQYNDACRDYINSLPSCRVIINPPSWISPECQRYVTNEINYSKCVDKYKNDTDFYDHDWRVYLSRDDVLWKNRRELIQLQDPNGKIINAITY